MDPIFETNLPGIERHARGKVRDVYSAGDFLVIVATDRLSAFDYVLPTPIPDKGRVLTALTIFWLEQLRDIVPNHFVSADVDRLSAASSTPIGINWKAARCWFAAPR